MISDKLDGILQGDTKTENKSEPCALTVNQALTLFSNERRRLVVEFVDTLGPMQIRALADAVATVTDCSRDGAYTTLYQSHLPKLDEHNVIDLGDRRHLIEPGEHFDGCAAFVEDVQTKFKSDNQHPAEFTCDELDEIAGGGRA